MEPQWSLKSSCERYGHGEQKDYSQHAKKKQSKPLHLESQWKQLRQTVEKRQQKDGMEQISSRTTNKETRICDLCEEDKVKVSKLIRQLIKVSSEQEQLEAELESAKQLVADFETGLEEMKSKFQRALEMLEKYQFKLKQSQEIQNAQSLKLTETMEENEVFKTEIKALKTSQHQQQVIYEDNVSDNEQQYRTEIHQLENELKNTKAELLITEKRLQVQIEDNQKLHIEKDTKKVMDTSSLDLSTMLNTSIHAPTKVNEILSIWMQRLQNALQTPLQNEDTLDSFSTLLFPQSTSTIRINNCYKQSCKSNQKINTLNSTFDSYLKDNRVQPTNTSSTKKTFAEVGCGTNDLDGSIENINSMQGNSTYNSPTRHTQTYTSFQRTPNESLSDIGPIYDMSLFDLVHSIENSMDGTTTTTNNTNYQHTLNRTNDSVQDHFSSNKYIENKYDEEGMAQILGNIL